jgi:hypothetical protein
LPPEAAKEFQLAAEKTMQRINALAKKKAKLEAKMAGLKRK